jgi:DNA-binding transcriptional MocR family regulator
MQEVIDKNPKEAAPGGNPEIGSRVRGYVAVVLRSQEKIDTYKAQVSAFNLATKAAQLMIRP